MTNILSVEELIKNKAELKRDDSKVYKASLLLDRLNAKIRLEMTKSEVRDFLEVTNDPKTKEEQYKAATYNLVYTIVVEPNLKDNELQKAYECHEPTDIVPALFDDGEIIDIVHFATNKTGFKQGLVTEVEEVKN